MQVDLAVNIVPTQPRWIEQDHVIYRLYINGELLTERNWVWPINVYIRELVSVELEPNQTHYLTLVILKDRFSLAKFALGDLVVNGVQKFQQTDEYETYFSFE